MIDSKQLNCKMKRKENNYIRRRKKKKRKQGEEGKRSDEGNTKDFSK